LVQFAGHDDLFGRRDEEVIQQELYGFAGLPDFGGKQ
jgi:hypothetical protein